MGNSCIKSNCPSSEEACRNKEAIKREEQRLWALEAQWQRKMAALRAAPCSDAAEETTIEQYAAEMHKAFRHDISPKDWTAFQKLIHRQKGRSRKAYNLLFKLLQENILHWWD